jgi:hypothetical protein
MKRIRIAGLCLVAVFALSAVVAASASAATMPTYKVCKKLSKVEGKYHGKYSVKTCATEATTKEQEEGKKNKYELGEWNEGKEAAPKFKDANGKSVLKLYVPGLGVVGTTECAKAKGTGTIIGPSEGSVTVTFEKCTSSGEVCTSDQVGEKTGDITTSLLTALLILVSKSPVVVASRVFPMPPATTSATFKCGKTTVETVGAADGEDVGNVGKIAKESTQIFATDTEGEALINDEEGGTPGEDTLYSTVSGVGTLPSGEETTATLKGEEMEIVPG